MLRIARPILLLMAMTAVSHAESAGAPPYVIIVNAANPISTLPREKIADIFLRQMQTWPDGTPIVVVDLPPSSSVREAFTSDVLKQSVAQVQRYWQQQVFSGRGNPPNIKPYESLIAQYVMQHAGAVGYVSANIKIDTVKVIAIAP
ncbi:MAG: substrate-binding domain-containing protein [Myxococcota bacterium]